MSSNPTGLQARETGHGDGPHTASFRLQIGDASLKGRASISSGGLLALGGLVSSILLSAAVVVLVSTRKLPEGTLPKGLHRG